MRAPLTGIALVVEITGNPGQVVPVALACGAATLVAHKLGGQPIYTVLLQRTLARARGG
jgi:CIC family chloride channel protein